MTTAPDAFVPYTRSSRYLDLIGPIYEHRDDASIVETRLVTVSLTTDFIGRAQLGEWVRGQATVHRCGRRLAFASCEFHVDDRLVLTSTGIFATTSTA